MHTERREASLVTSVVSMAAEKPPEMSVPARLVLEIDLDSEISFVPRRAGDLLSILPTQEAFLCSSMESATTDTTSGELAVLHSVDEVGMSELLMPDSDAAVAVRSTVSRFNWSGVLNNTSGLMSPAPCESANMLQKCSVARFSQLRLHNNSNIKRTVQSTGTAYDRSSLKCDGKFHMKILHLPELLVSSH